VRLFRSELLALAARTREQELRWHLAQLLPRLGLARSQRRTLVSLLRNYLTDPSAIVRLSALQALADVMVIDQDLRPLVRRHLRRALAAGSPAERARARKLLAASAV